MAPTDSDRDDIAVLLNRLTQGHPVVRATSFRSSMKNCTGWRTVIYAASDKAIL